MTQYSATRSNHQDRTASDDEVQSASAPTDPRLSFGALLFRFYLFASVGIFGIAGLPITLFGQKASLRFCQFWARSVIAALKICCGIDHTIIGVQNIPKGGVLIAANHQSMWETVLLFSLLEKPVIIAKYELMNLPIFGYWLARCGAISIDRQAGPKAMRSLIKDTKAAIENSAQVVIFPEGTRAKPGEIIPLKPGIAGIYGACNAPVVPIGHDSGRHWIYPGWRKRPGIIRMEIGAPIEPGLTRKIFIEKLSSAMNAARADIKNLASR